MQTTDQKITILFVKEKKVYHQKWPISQKI